MKQFLDYIPLAIFFTVWAIGEHPITVFGYAYTLGGIFSAADFLLVSSIIVYGSIYLAQRHLDKFQIITLAVVILFCIPTIVFRDTTYLKWKAPVANWLFATVFFASRYLSAKPAIEHMMGHAVDAPRELWLKLNNFWIAFFIVLGAVNLAVAFTLSEAAWILFKVWGNLILTFLFILGQMPYLSKYLPDEEPSSKQ